MHIDGCVSSEHAVAHIHTVKPHKTQSVQSVADALLDEGGCDLACCACFGNPVCMTDMIRLAIHHVCVVQCRGVKLASQRPPFDTSSGNAVTVQPREGARDH
jgi:hypothetical protein